VLAARRGLRWDDQLPTKLNLERISRPRTLSTQDQKLDRQTDALIRPAAAGSSRRRPAARNAGRPELLKCPDYARHGGRILVLELWRLGRSWQGLVTIVAGLRRRGIGFKSLHEALDTTTPGAGSCSYASPRWPRLSESDPGARGRVGAGAAPDPAPSSPACGYRPSAARELELHRDGLATAWLAPRPRPARAGR
jgi:hypothetical protein